MEKDKILVIDQSKLLTLFLKEELENHAFEVIIAKNVFEGIIKMKNSKPELVIVDYYLVENDPRNDFFKEKRTSKTVADIPVVVLSSSVDMTAVIQAAKNKVSKVFAKPIKISELLACINTLLNLNIQVDQTPCSLDVHLNDDILFIEMGLGLNNEKITSLKYKILELKEIYQKKRFKILLLLHDINLQGPDREKLILLIRKIIQATSTPLEAFKVLTASQEIKSIIAGQDKFRKIEVFNDIALAMNSLGEMKLENLVSTENIASAGELDISTDLKKSSFQIQSMINIAIVDDDEMIIDLVTAVLMDIDCKIHAFSNGEDFLNQLPHIPVDLIFLDLMMPKKTGFEVLEELDNSVPVIIFSALSKKETVVKALKYGVRSYIVKPIEQDIILKKTREILYSNF